jgi:hypothetical protein
MRGIKDTRHTCDEYLVLLAKSSMTGDFRLDGTNGKFIQRF